MATHRGDPPLGPEVSGQRAVTLLPPLIELGERERLPQVRHLRLQPPSSPAADDDRRPADGGAEPGDVGRGSKRKDDQADESTVEPKVGKATSDKPKSAPGEIIELSTSDPDHKKLLNNPPPDCTIKVDGSFTYEIDGLGRVRKASATLDAVDFDHPRSKYAQRTLKGKLPGDHAGHLFARIFLAPGQRINLTPMEGERVNKTYFATLEREWRQHIEDGHTVNVTVELAFSDDGPRASHIRVVYDVDGKIYRRTILNTPRHDEES